MAVFVFGAFLCALPKTASSATISFTSSATPLTIAATGDTTNSFTYTLGATTANFDPTSGVFFNGLTQATSFGEFVDNQPGGSGNPNTTAINVAATISGGGSASVTYSGTVSSFVLSGKTLYDISFAGMTGANVTQGVKLTDGNTYTQVAVNGVDYDIETTQQLNSSTNGKETWLKGFVQGVPLTASPEPASIASSGLALVLAAFYMRRKRNANQN